MVSWGFIIMRIDNGVAIAQGEFVVVLKNRDVDFLYTRALATSNAVAITGLSRGEEVVAFIHADDQSSIKDMVSAVVNRVFDSGQPLNIEVQRGYISKAFGFDVSELGSLCNSGTTQYYSRDML